MKKKKALLVAFLALACNAGAQHAFRGEWAFGASGGMNVASVSFSPKVQEHMLTGYHGGLTIRRITEKNLGLQLEVNVKQQGWKENFAEAEVPEGVTYRYQRRMNYVEIPFLTHIYFGGDRLRFFVNLGPQVGLLLSEGTDENLNGAEPHLMNAQHTMPVEKKMEWGLGGGPGLELRTRAGCFLLEGRYYYALSDFYNTRRQDAFSKASSQVISIKLSYLITL